MNKREAQFIHTCPAHSVGKHLNPKPLKASTHSAAFIASSTRSSKLAESYQDEEAGSGFPGQQLRVVHKPEGPVRKMGPQAPWCISGPVRVCLQEEETISCLEAETGGLC